MKVHPVAVFALALVLIAGLRCAGDERRVEIGPDLVLRVTTSGEGEGEPVILIPSPFGSAFAYRKVMAELARTGRMAVVIEPLGFAGSSRPAQADYSFTAQADRVATTMERLGILRTVVVAQASASSIALRLALRHPARVRAIVSIEGGAAEATLTGGLRRALRFAPLLKLLGGRSMVRRAVRNTLKDGSADARWVTESVVDGYMPPPEFDFDAIVRGLRGMARSREPGRLAPRLSEVACPVRLLIGGAPHRGGIEPEELRTLRAGLRRLTVVTVAGSGHFLNEENPSAVRQAIEDGARDGAEPARPEL